MHTAITAFFDMIKSYFTMQTSDNEHKSEKEVVKDKKNLKKASDIAERIITLVDNYKDTFSKSDQRQYRRLVERFKKFN